MSYAEIRNHTEKLYGWLFKGRDLEKEPYHKRRIAQTKQLIAEFYQGGAILDVGWNSYPIAYDIATSEYIGIDFLFHYTAGFPRVLAVICDFDHLPFREEPLFDFVLWSEGPEHSLDPYRTLQGLRKVCKGRILLTCPPSSPINWEHKTMIKDKDALRQLLASQFTVIKLGDVPPHWIYGVGET